MFGTFSGSHGGQFFLCRTSSGLSPRGRACPPSWICTRSDAVCVVVLGMHLARASGPCQQKQHVAVVRMGSALFGARSCADPDEDEVSGRRHAGVWSCRQLAEERTLASVGFSSSFLHKRRLLVLRSRCAGRLVSSHTPSDNIAW